MNILLVCPYDRRVASVMVRGFNGKYVSTLKRLPTNFAKIAKLIVRRTVDTLYTSLLGDGEMLSGWHCHCLHDGDASCFSAYANLPSAVRATLCSHVLSAGSACFSAHANPSLDSTCDAMARTCCSREVHIL